MKKQTAVEWYAVKDGELTIQYLEGKINGIELAVKKTKCLEQAKAMEKEQQIKFANDFLFHDNTDLTAEQYYNETYNNTQS